MKPNADVATFPPMRNTVLKLALLGSIMMGCAYMIMVLVTTAIKAIQ